MDTSQYLEQLNKLGISENDFLKQLEQLKTGFPFLKIKGAATCKKGVLQLSENEQVFFEEKYNKFSGTRTKFVPASGAASRMFKMLFEAQKCAEDGYDLAKLKEQTNQLKKFFENLHKFAFYEALQEYKVQTEEDVINCLLSSDGLNYGNLPKGLLLFHKYPDFKRTPLEEHLLEAAKYASEPISKKANLHFTVSPEHLELFNNKCSDIIKQYKEKYEVDYDISFSIQQASTNSIAVDAYNKPIKNKDGSLLFRPGGHGALLQNVNAIDSDIVFIKNIDNVVPESKVFETVKWKKIIAGVLISMRDTIFEYITFLENEELSLSKINEISDFLEKNFCISFKKEVTKEMLLEKLNRPIRVCGMVKNEGEPGGGPFIIEDKDGSTSLQILETSQIDKDSKRSMQMLANSTHFNPVDLVCSFKNYKGEKFDLNQYRDESTGFVSEKSQAGKVLKALELPGLWNGAMSNWNTVFVEVPIKTFNPVKVVNDLLREEHQL